MKRLITFLMLGALCVAAAASAAKPPPKTQVLAAKNAAWACKALRTTMGTQAFLNAYGGNHARGAGAMRNAFGKCVSQKSHEADGNGNGGGNGNGNGEGNGNGGGGTTS